MLYPKVTSWLAYLAHQLRLCLHTCPVLYKHKSPCISSVLSVQINLSGALKATSSMFVTCEVTKTLKLVHANSEQYRCDDGKYAL